MKTLENAESYLGKIKESVKNRIIDYIKNPTIEKWDDIFTIIVKTNSDKTFDGCITIWTAMLLHDPTFPKSGRTYDENNVILKEWERIPRPLELLTAIKNVTS